MNIKLIGLGVLLIACTIIVNVFFTKEENNKEILSKQEKKKKKIENYQNKKDKPKMTEADKKMEEEIERQSGLSKAEIEQIKKDNDKRVKDFISADEVHKNYEKSKKVDPNADYYRITAE